MTAVPHDALGQAQLLSCFVIATELDPSSAQGQGSGRRSWALGAGTCLFLAVIVGACGLGAGSDDAAPTGGADPAVTGSVSADSSSAETSADPTPAAESDTTTSEVLATAPAATPPGRRVVCIEHPTNHRRDLRELPYGAMGRARSTFASTPLTMCHALPLQSPSWPKLASCRHGLRAMKAFPFDH